MKLVDDAEVLNRLSGIPGLRVPDTVKPERIGGHIEEASGIVMQRGGYTTAPAKGTPARQVLDGFVIRLAVLGILGDLFGANPEMREANRRERNDLLAELEGQAEDDVGGDGEVFFEQV